MTIDVVVNPVHRGALHARTRVQGLCARAGVSITVRTTSIARPHADPASDARLTVVIGGDGTLREVAGALLSDPRWHGAILPVPTGTASLFALAAGVHSTADGIGLLEAYLNDVGTGADEHILDRPRQEGPHDPGGSGGRAARRWALLRCDVGRAEIRRAGGQGTSALPFLVSAGIGHSGSAILRTPHWAKTLFGPAGYGVGAIGRLGAGPVSVRLREESGVTPAHVHAEVWAAEFGNISRIPSGITVFPHGGLRTGSLAGLLVSFPRDAAVDTHRPLRLRHRIPGWGRIFRAGFLGGHEHVDELRLWSAGTAHVEADRPLAAHLDGESVGMVTGLRLRLVPAALPVVVPAEAAMRAPSGGTGSVRSGGPTTSLVGDGPAVSVDGASSRPAWS